MGLAEWTWTPRGGMHGLGFVHGIAVVPHYADIRKISWQEVIDRLAPGGIGYPRAGRADGRPRRGRTARRERQWTVAGPGAAWWFARGADEPVVARSGEVLRLPDLIGSTSGPPYPRLTSDRGRDCARRTTVTSARPPVAARRSIQLRGTEHVSHPPSVDPNGGRRPRPWPARDRSIEAGIAIGADRATSVTPTTTSAANAAVSTDPALAADLDALLRADQTAGRNPPRPAGPVAAKARINAAVRGLRRLAAARKLIHATVVADLPKARRHHDDPARPRHDHGGERDLALGRRDGRDDRDRQARRRDPRAARRREGDVADLKTGDEVFVMSRVESDGTVAYLVVVPAI
jgi:hypothetical protein